MILEVIKPKLRSLINLWRNKGNNSLGLPPPIPHLPREEIILKYVTLDAKGIEIAPWCHPLAPKRNGFKIKTVDVFDTETLRNRCRDDELTKQYIDAIEEVDIVSSATDLDTAIESLGELGSYDYIISSHNFEHLPNPIRFLQACSRVLKPGGVLSMAIPDKGGTFDRLGRPTRTVDFLENYLTGSNQPTPYQIFEFSAHFVDGVDPTIDTVNLDKMSFRNDLRDCYKSLVERITKPGLYQDTHVSLFTPQSFDLLMSELNILDLNPFKTLEIIETNMVEFYVHLKNVGIESADNLKIDSNQRLNMHKSLTY
jgi:SAM-dependent methyltransferase